ncbi:class I SAM-dependent methyltransferase [Chroococcidiopsis sp. FACHB-1243]|uniref:class I SAM-dependent methyltransferase n=1 Tax=Chroococcidiopsis sp. [FACHB-1243] TaxID=2692781 RepID=UPI001781E7F3|nr:class I SAM-dependent methyltransferase [Chroococcidiopsis sp. [FACHB-1243]]MBD2308787.1 class I SAM-dependent methyltransferase [Chroococcidiopsis sp. [FACHB-1243]]
MLDNKKIYQSTEEFNTWAYGKGLKFEEKYLIDNYLDKHLKTVEAGTAGGRILLEMRKMGFTSLIGYDYVPEFIEQAKQKDPSSEITFEVEDATKLSYVDDSFAQILYLQQIISSIDGDQAKLKAFEEAYRILKPGGTALFSFLCFEVRAQTLIYKPYLVYLRILRSLQAKSLSLQYLPWLKLGGKWNLSALLDREPYVYWYRPQEVEQLLRTVGFEVTAVGSSAQIEGNSMCTSVEELARQPLAGGLYFVCTK